MAIMTLLIKYLHCQSIIIPITIISLFGTFFNSGLSAFFILVCKLGVRFETFPKLLKILVKMTSAYSILFYQRGSARQWSFLLYSDRRDNCVHNYTQSLRKHLER